MRITKYNSTVFANPNSLIHDYQTLGIRSYLAPQQLAWVLKTVSGKIRNISKMTTKVLIGHRVTYKSAPALHNIQTKLGAMLVSEQNKLSLDHVLSYRAGVDFYKELPKYTGSKYLVQLDICKYFDNITITKIVHCLTQPEHGFTEEGATLLARYLVVRRKSHIGNFWENTLQQGSPASPAMSNIIGYHMFDKPIMAACTKLENKYPGLKMRYIRYCDNLSIFLDGEFPIDVLSEFKSAVHEIIIGAKFRYHQWSITPLNHPKKNQRMLGVVLNDTARLEKSKYIRLRATLFNACTQGKQKAINEFFIQNAIQVPKDPEVADQVYSAKFNMILQGRVSNMKSANAVLGTQVKKLFSAMKILDSFGGVLGTYSSTLPSDVFAVLKSYKNHRVSVEEFADTLSKVCEHYR